jgi:glycosyltransferase involved in cell wall biosynthesis
VRSRLKNICNIKVVEAPCLSNGLLRRILIVIHAWWNQGKITHVTGDITFATLLLPRQTTVLTILDCGILIRTTGIRRWIIRKLWFDLPMKKCRFVTTISQSAAADLLSNCSLDEAKLKIIPVAISERFTFHPKEAPHSKRPRLLHIGTAPNKNLPRLIEAIAGLDVELCIIGKISSECESKLTTYNIRYRNLYNISEDAIIDEYRNADIVCFVSLYEGFGMPILEAQAIGRPVLTSNRSSMPEVAGDAALLVNPESVLDIREGIVQLMNSPELCKLLVARGCENVKRFSPLQIASAYANLYAEIDNQLARSK